MSRSRRDIAPAANGTPAGARRPEHAPERGAFNLRDASVYLGLEAGSRWLADAPIPRVDIRKPGAGKPVWRWRKVDLDTFLERRVVQPGQPNPMDLQ